MFRAPSILLATVKIPLKPQKPYLIHEAGLKKLPPLSTEITVDSDKLLADLEMMLRLRRMESVCDQAYKMRKIRGFCHLYIGQEAICVGAENVLDFKDTIVTGYREHCWYVMRGGKPREVFAELFGRGGGCSKGKGGSMHIFNSKNGFFGGNGIVGAQVSIGAGLAWKFAHDAAAKGTKPEHVGIALYGDGAANQGQIFESFNMAALWKLPCIFICENNQFGMGTSKKRASADPNFYKRAGYIPGIKADGMNLLAVQEVMRLAKNWCLEGNGPIVIEMDSYRYMGHSMSDPDSAYRTKKDIESVRTERDCVMQLKNLMIEHGFITEDVFKTLEKKVKKEMDAELQAAEAMPPTDLKELTNDVLSGEQFPIRGVAGTQWWTAGEAPKVVA